jgi:hypothetical protein
MLDLEQIQLLDNAKKTRYMALEKLFEHPSFKYFMEWAKQEEADHTQRVLTAQTWDQHCFHTGARFAFNAVVNFEVQVEQEFAGYAQDALETKYELDELQNGTEE